MHFPKMAFIAALLAAVIVAAAAPARADELRINAYRCSSSTIDPDLKIGACNWLLNSGRLFEIDIPTAFNNRGNAYDDKGQYDRAIRDFDEAIRLKPDYAYAFNNRGFAYKNKGHYDRAIRDFDEAIRLKPDYARAFGNRGEAYEKLGRRDQALRNYKKLYELGSHPKWLIDKLREYGALP